MPVRVDKYLWAVRLFKTRSVATDAVKKGKVLIGGHSVKPARNVSAGDVFELKVPIITRSFRVLQELENRVGAKLVPQYVVEITPASELQKLDTWVELSQGQRDRGTGRPTKRDRRDLDKLLEWDLDDWALDDSGF